MTYDLNIFKSRINRHLSGFPIMRGHAVPPIHDIFLEPPPKVMPPMGQTPLKRKPPLLKSKAHFQERFLEKKQKKSGTVINNFHSFIKQHSEIPQKCAFLTWSYQNFVRKVKQFVRKYYNTWLIDLANIWHRKISWFHFMPSVIKYCLVFFF